MYYVEGAWFENVADAIEDAQWLCRYLNVGDDNFVCIVDRLGLVVALVQHEDIRWFNDEARKVYEDHIEWYNNEAKENYEEHNG